MFSSSGPNILKYTCEKKRKEKQKMVKVFSKENGKEIISENLCEIKNEIMKSNSNAA